MAVVEKKQYQLDDLLYLMEQLRHPEHGCDWDKAQTLVSLKQYTLEEIYELIDAIDMQDTQHIQEELGDVLFQTVFYSQIAKESGDFSFTDVVHGLVSKLVRRHPHVFANNDLYQQHQQTLSNEAVKQQWEEIKQQERAAKQQVSLLDDVPKALPALIRAQKLQKRASGVGFDWPDTESAIEKIYEELDELKEAIASNDVSQLQAELGDVLFCCVNIARHLGVDAEQALMSSNDKFVKRMESIEQALAEQGKTVHQSSLMEMDELWEKAKISLKKRK